MQKPNIYNKALDVLQAGSTPKGFLASTQATDNYQRIWARDAVITGLGCLFTNHSLLVNTFESSLNLLAKHQSKFGQIASNISVDEKNVSFGSLAGRVDATSWYIIGCCAYALTQKDDAFANQHQPHLEKALEVLSVYEFNNRGLVYTPLSGNWADEFIFDGYLLYDQLLRYWALQLYQKTYQLDCKKKIHQLRDLIVQNYQSGQNPEHSYHVSLYKSKLPKLNYWVAGFNPSRYFAYFDAFANALALLLLNHSFNQKAIKYLIQTLENQFLIPAHSPVINPEDSDWKLLKSNHSYAFKNHPNTYHNGGLWPMVNGWVGWALHLHNQTKASAQVEKNVHELNQKEDFAFYEHYHAKTLAPLGTKHQLWSASASVLLHHLNLTEKKHPVTKILFEP